MKKYEPKFEVICKGCGSKNNVDVTVDYGGVITFKCHECGSEIEIN